MADVAPITLKSGRTDLTHDCRVIDDFIAVVDGREDYQGAVCKARELIRLVSEFQAVSVATESSTVRQSRTNIFNSFYSKKFHLAHQGIVLPVPDKKSYYRFDPDLLKSMGKRPYTVAGNYKSIYRFRANSVLGRDYNQAIMTGREVFPEYLSWHLRSGTTRKPGGMHFDAPYRQAHINTRNLLAKRILNAVANKQIDPLPGTVTLTVSLRGGGSIIAKCDNNDLPEQHFNEYGKQGHQAMDGDLLIMRGLGWPDPEFLAAYHGAALHPNGRDVAVASSWASFLDPQVLDLYGPEWLEDDDEPRFAL